MSERKTEKEREKGKGENEDAAGEENKPKRVANEKRIRYAIFSFGTEERKKRRKFLRERRRT